MKDGAECACCDSFGCKKLKTRMDFLDSFLVNQGKEINEADYLHYLQAYEDRPRLLKIRENMKKNGKLQVDE